ncbi:MAG TPA: sigma 54-interacting transcriptional regulator [Planctomycetota bacterium]|nr:sigma 54-interacting transcriptional regulator [Planctomycetota bacterium]HRR78578.1 sigma 54-interacting transcriptional regulator [Planctomycetota bacterium]HRT96575.1 sigma 54-interacting transcriptional regulator [Planctomycetota bacterium]
MYRLVVIGGPESGKVFHLPPGQYVAGRGAGADILLADDSVSRRHASLTVSEDGVTLLDLGSHNGTRVNGQPVKSAQIVEGDEVRFGDSRAVLERSAAGAGATVILPPEGRPSLVRSRQGIALPEDSRRLAILYDVGTAINSTLALSDVLGRILSTIFEVVPAERGAVVLWDPAERQWRPAATHTREGAGSGGDIVVSRAIIEKAFEAGRPLLSGDARSDARFGHSDSIEALAIRSTICCPLVVRGERLGVLHLDTRGATEAFTEADVRLVGAIANQAAIAIANARLHDVLRQENVQLRRALGARHCIVGESAAMRELIALIRRVSQTDATVLLRGESGTGKEVVARTLHALGPRRARPLVCVNCAAVPEALLESELFGHEKGAFTGAIERRIGRFEQANGGTVFLDEIAEMPPTTQAKILRVLQEREFQRVGGTTPLKVDVRLIASTNRDLEAAMASGGFRRDLYYRLKVIEVTLPPLRERREDIRLLCAHFLEEIAREMGRQAPAVDEAVLRILEAYPWPGNVRELRNVLERAVVLGAGERLMPSHLPREVRGGYPGQGELPDDLTLAAAERRHVSDVLALTGWNKSRAAALMRISRPRLDRKIREYGLERPEGGEGEASHRPPQ